MIDIGGGDSRLVDHLLARGLRCLTVLDVSDLALARARARVAVLASQVSWIVADVTADTWPVPSVDIWHDRAVFHFLIEADDRARYAARVHQAVRLGGSAIIGTFALEGPERCSGLPVRRYDVQGLRAELGEGFTVEEAVADAHRTPAGSVQSFLYVRLVRRR